MFVELDHLQRQAVTAFQRGNQGRDNTVATGREPLHHARLLQLHVDLHLPALPVHAVARQPPFGRHLQVETLEQGPDRARIHLGPGRLGLRLHLPGEFHGEPAGQADTMIAFQHVCHAALAGLAVDPHHGLVAAAQVQWIDGQVGHVPRAAVAGAVAETFANRVLVTAGERGVHQFAGPGMAGVYRLGRAIAIHPLDPLHIGQI